MPGSNDRSNAPPVASVADPYLDLLASLSRGQRQGLVQRLAAGYYEGWFPSRLEVAALIARESGWMSQSDRNSLLALARRPSPQTVPAGRHHTAPPTNPAAPAPSTIGPSASPTDSSAGARRDSSPTPGLAALGLPAAGEPFLVVPAPGPPASERPPPVRAPLARPRTMLQFDVPCTAVAPHAEFVATGLSSGTWLARGSRVCRLVSLHYTLGPPASQSGDDPSPFNGTILCRPDVPGPHEPGDGSSSQHLVRSGRVVGVRGPWPIPPTARQVRFLIYPQTEPNDVAEHHPVGVLLVDLMADTAQWHPVSGLHAEQTMAGEHRIAPG